MGFFKNFLSDVVGESAAESISNVSSSLAKKAGQKAAEKAISTAAERATEHAVNCAVDKAADSLNRKSALNTPPPPAVPKFESLSVMVAVNGETYGPYEKTALMEMIGNGSLTRDTYVFLEGMSEWQPAGKVEKVACLFGSKTPLPPAPPKPWANSSNAPAKEKSASEGQSDNTLSPRLNKLIDAAVADGEISDLERQVLIRNAQEEGVAMDEFVMVLEARLFEQRKNLLAQEEAKKRAEQEMQIRQSQAARASKPAATQQSKPTHTKCPHCGAPLKAMATSCPECGYEYNAQTQEGNSASEQLNRMLMEVDNEPQGLLTTFFSAGQDSPKKIAKKKSIITNFPIPSDKRNIFDFFVSCATIATSGSALSRYQNPLISSYKTKAQQILIKARIVMRDDPAMLEEINQLAKKYKIKA